MALFGCFKKTCPVFVSQESDYLNLFGGGFQFFFIILENSIAIVLRNSAECLSKAGKFQFMQTWLGVVFHLELTLWLYKIKK